MRSDGWARECVVESLIGLAVLCAALCMLAAGASSAFAERTFDSDRTRLQRPEQRRLRRRRQRLGHRHGHDSTNHPGRQRPLQVRPYPSQTLLDAPERHDPGIRHPRAYSSRSINPTGEVFVAQSNGRKVDIFAPNSRHPYTERGASINGHELAFSCEPASTSPSTTPTPTRGAASTSLSPARERRRGLRRRPAPGRLPGHRQLHRRQQTDRHAQRAVRRVQQHRGRLQRQHLCHRHRRTAWSTSSTRPAPSCAPSRPGPPRESRHRWRGRRPDQRQRP